MPQYVSIKVPRLNIGAGSAGTVYTVWPYAEKGRYVRGYFMPNANTTAHGTNYATATLAFGGTTMQARATSGTGFTAGTAEALAPTGTGLAPEVSDGEAISLAKTEAAAGAALDLDVELVFELVRV